MQKILTKLAGVKYGNAQQIIKEMDIREIKTFDLLREPHNRFDQNAIRVMHQSLHIGFIPQGWAKVLAPRMDLGAVYEVHPVKKNISPQHETLGLTIEIIEVTPAPENLLYLCLVENDTA